MYRLTTRISTLLQLGVRPIALPRVPIYRLLSTDAPTALNSTSDTPAQPITTYSNLPKYKQHQYSTNLDYRTRTLSTDDKVMYCWRELSLCIKQYHFHRRHRHWNVAPSNGNQAKITSLDMQEVLMSKIIALQVDQAARDRERLSQKERGHSNSHGSGCGSFSGEI